jgi:DNA repair protein RecO (recombination protein O)
MIHTRALILRRVDYSETSQIVTADTRDRGIVELLAKGSRRPARRGSSFAAPLDLGGWYDIVYRPRRGELALATEARLIEGFPALRGDLSAWLEACFALDVLRGAFTAGDPHPELLRATLSYLKLLGVGRGRLALRVRFACELLAASGVASGWEQCASCRLPLSDHAAWHPPAALVCERCRAAGDRPVSLPLRRTLGRIAELPWGSLPSEEFAAEPLAEAWARHSETILSHLERAPRTLRYLRM